MQYMYVRMMGDRVQFGVQLDLEFAFYIFICEVLYQLHLIQTNQVVYCHCYMLQYTVKVCQNMNLILYSFSLLKKINITTCTAPGRL